MSDSPPPLDDFTIPYIPTDNSTPTQGICHIARLPFELWLLVVELLDFWTLLSLRAVSKKACAFTTRHAFRTIVCTSKVSSTKSVRNLLGNEYIRTCIEKAVYADGSGERGKKGSWADSDIVDWVPLDQGAMCKGLVAALQVFLGLPTLRALAFTFRPATEEGAAEHDDPHWRGYTVQHAALDALSRFTPASTIKSLTLDHFRPMPHEAYNRLEFIALFRHLTHLRLSTKRELWNRTEGDPDDPLRTFWQQCAPPLLRASADTLTSLSLHVSQDEASCFGVSISELHFPHLTRLSFQHVLFGFETSAEPFILAHAATLSSLTLVYCKISMGSAETPSRTWEQVYGDLSAGLGELRELDVEERSWEWYARWEPGGMWQWGFPDDSEQAGRDRMALEGFRQVVRARDV
ncbi:hypothetical protein BV25DRAFT_1821379 [Artomyces pyxidatus]|uniref:Uncharacterized protein n=1 Tax=Artomyces pyxidatus TaxID=48021 RepID=A0ACB8TB32_9AGAM|nr:hypothetical protein BV25DRAFT_1821379 [Artomyces pyxidatus]